MCPVDGEETQERTGPRNEIIRHRELAAEQVPAEPDEPQMGTEVAMTAEQPRRVPALVVRRYRDQWQRRRPQPQPLPLVVIEEAVDHIARLIDDLEGAYPGGLRRGEQGHRPVKVLRHGHRGQAPRSQVPGNLVAVAGVPVILRGVRLWQGQSAALSPAAALRHGAPGPGRTGCRSRPPSRSLPGMWSSTGTT